MCDTVTGVGRGGGGCVTQWRVLEEVRVDV